MHRRIRPEPGAEATGTYKLMIPFLMVFKSCCGEEISGLVFSIRLKGWAPTSLVLTSYNLGHVYGCTSKLISNLFFNMYYGRKKKKKKVNSVGITPSN